MTRISKANKLAEDGEVDNKTLSQASQALKRWANIDVYTPAGEFREFDVIMTELAAKWDQLSDAEQANISFAIAATRQTAVLKSILEQWTSAMDLATEATNAQGNALANQQKYMDSMQGKIQALKTEVSDLWIEILNSDSLKNLIEGLKDIVASLRNDSSGGLKSLVDLLSQIFRAISKIISILPAGGIITSLIGFKIGKKLPLNDIIKFMTKATTATNVLTDATAASATATQFLTKAWSALGVAFQKNPVGVVVTLLSVISLISKALQPKSIEEIHAELTQTYNDAEAKVSETSAQIDILNNKLQEQQDIISQLSNKKLSYYDKEQLDQAKATTAELENQLQIAKDTYAYNMRIQAEAAAGLWDETYVNDRASVIEKYANYLKPMWGNPNSTIKYFEENPDFVNDAIASYEGISEISKALGRFIKWEDLDTEKVASEITYMDEQLSKFKTYYETVSENGKDEQFVADYANMREMRNEAMKHMYATEWDREVYSGIVSDKQVRAELNALTKEVNQWKAKYPWHADDDAYIFDLIKKLINSGDFEALREKVQEEFFSKSNWDKSNNAYIFGQMFYGNFQDGVEEAFERNPIDLAMWYADKSTLDNDKTWKEMTDSLFAGLDKVGEFVKTHRRAGESLIGLDVFNETGVDDTIFKLLGVGDLNTYLTKYADDAQRGFDEYITAVIDAFLKAVGNTDDINGFELILDKLNIWRDRSRGGARKEDIDNAVSSYEKIFDVYQQAKNGKLFTGEEVSQLEEEYGSLADQLTLVGDKYYIETDALKELTNQQVESANKQIAAQIETNRQTLEGLRERNKKLQEYRNEDIDIQIEMTQNTIDQVEARVKALGVETQYLQAILRTYNLLQGTPELENSFKDMFGEDAYAEMLKLIEAYNGLDEALITLQDQKKLLETLKNGIKITDDLDSNSKNEIDWIANSLENLARKVEEEQTAYDQLWTIAGSPTALKAANDNLKAINDKLENQADGLHKAAKAYENEFYSLGLSDKDIDRIQNEAWTIEEFKNDSETYDRLNKGLDFYKKWQDQLKNETDVRHQILENDIQQLQNINDLYSNTTTKLEAQLALATRAKSAQKIYDQIRESQDAQYATAVAIAKLKGDEIEEEKLLAEWAQKTNETIAEKRQFTIDAVITRYDRVISEFENRQAVLEHGTNMLESKGYLANENYYRALIDNEITTVEKLFNERNNLVEKLNQIDLEGIASKEDLDQWWDLKEQIDGVTQSLYESEESIQEWQNAIDDLRYDVFNRIQDAIAEVNTEAEFLINLFKNDDLFKSIKQLLNGDTFATKIYQGGYSNEGLAVLGLHQMQLKTNAELAENYANELAEVNKKLQDDPANVKLLDRRNELLEAQRDAIEAAESEKDAILDLVREGYDKQLESLEALSSKYMEVLQQEKEMYEYNKNIAKQTKDISTLRKRMASLMGDTSEEARSRMQQISVQLQEAEDNLRDTQYDRYISDQQNLLDQMYKNFEGYFDEQMEDRDARLKEIGLLVDNNFSSIKDILTGTANDAGAGMTRTMSAIWEKPMSDISSIESNIDSTDTNLEAVKSSTTNIDGYLKNYVNTYDLKLKNVLKDKDTDVAEISKNISSLNNDFGFGSHLYTILSDQKLRDDSRDQLIEELKNKIGTLDTHINIPTIDELEAMVVRAIDASKKKDASSSGSSGTYAGGSKVKPLPDSKLVPDEENDGMFWGVDENDFINGTRDVDASYAAAVYNKMWNDGGFLYEQSKYGPFEDDPRIYQIMYNWLHKRRKSLATGAHRIHNNEYAWTQEKGLEAIIRSSDGAILTPLSRGDSVLNAGATQNIWDMANNPMKFIRDNLSFPINLAPGLSGGNYDIQQNMAITLPNVQNYSEFVTALQNDKKFEKMLQDMTVNQLTNKNALAKYKYRY